MIPNLKYLDQNDEFLFDVAPRKRWCHTVWCQHSSIVVVLLWGCFSSHGTGDLARVEKIMKKEQYNQILQQNVVLSGLRIIGNGFFFQPDNNSKHSSKLCRSYLEHKGTEGVLIIMVWSRQSPNLNLIELLWEEIDRNVHNCCPSSQGDM